jgi:site-specific DNA recombinase
MTTKPAKRVRCAVYTRVSTEYGLDQEFNSLDAQHEAVEACVRSQAHDGWTLIRTRYDDGGYSGGSTERPALQRLLADIRDHRIDIVVVYKAGRLLRDLAGRNCGPIDMPPTAQALSGGTARAGPVNDRRY